MPEVRKYTVYVQISFEDGESNELKRLENAYSTEDAAAQALIWFEANYYTKNSERHILIRQVEPAEAE